MTLKTFSGFVPLLLFVVSAFGQIVDDSTKLVYGPTSTRYITVEHLKHNDTLFHVLDTALNALEAYQVKKRQDDYYYDLGNNGTAIRPIYYSIPQTIGRTTGFHAYDPYVKQAEDLKYYDTKSPYIHLGTILGGSGRNFVDFSFSRNVDPQLNVGFDITRIATQKQLGSASLREQQVVGTGLDLYTYYHTKKRNYHVMFHLYKFEHSANETGGILEDTEPEDYFQHLDASINLTTAFSEDQRDRIYVYQQFSVKPFFEIFTSTEHSNTRNEYNDISPDSDYYQGFLIRTDSTKDASQLKEWNNKLGIKGRVIDRIYYSAYLKRRDLDFSYRYLDDLDRISENYVGGDVKFWLTPNNKIGGSAEIADEGQYNLEGYFENTFLSARYVSNSSLPNFMSQRYFGNHYEWDNSFSPIFANSIQGSAILDLSYLRLEPQIELTTLKNFVFFNRSKLPSQNRGTMLLNRYGVKANFKLGNFRLDNHLIYGNVGGDNADVMRIPEWNWYGRWYYQNIFFDQMEMQLGLDMRWQSSYFGNAYDPITQQFYLQDALEVESYFASDLFLIIKSFDLSLFVKVNYLNQQRDNGYFEVPYYPGMRRLVDLGLRWMFFE